MPGPRFDFARRPKLVEGQQAGRPRPRGGAALQRFLRHTGVL